MLRLSMIFHKWLTFKHKSVVISIAHKTALLDKECSKEDIYKIAICDFDWKIVGRRLLGEQKVNDIDKEGSSEQDKRDKMLLKWKETMSCGATYQALMDVLRDMHYNETAARVQELEHKGINDIVIDCITFTYAKYYRKFK